MSDKLAGFFGCLFMIAFVGYGVAQLWAGWLGVQYFWGGGWATAVMIFCIMTRIGFPLTIGAFFCARDVWHWHWFWALCFTAPGLLFFTGSMLTSILALLANKGAAGENHSVQNEERMTLEAELVPMPSSPLAGIAQSAVMIDSQAPALDQGEEDEEFWHVSDDGQELGAMTATQIRQLIKTGRISKAAFVYRPEYGRWLSLVEAGILP